MIPSKTLDILGTNAIADHCVTRSAHDDYMVDGDDLNHIATLAYRLVHGPALDIEEYSGWAKVLHTILQATDIRFAADLCERPSEEGTP